MAANANRPKSLTLPPEAETLTLPALSLVQPYASLVEWLEKLNETRGQTTHRRGPLAIHASLDVQPWARKAVKREPRFGETLARHGTTLDALPLGKVLCVTYVTASRPVESLRHLSAQELAFGDYTPGLGRFAYRLEHTRPLPYPVPARGMPGLWPWTPEDPDIARWLRLWLDWREYAARHIAEGGDGDLSPECREREAAFRACDAELRARADTLRARGDANR